MLTNRARWMIFFGVIGTLGGLLRSQNVLALLSLAVLAWLFLEWTLFRWRVEVQFRSIKCQRVVNGSRDRQGTLWTGRPISVLVRLRSTALTRIPFLRLEDYAPENLEAIDGDNVVDATLSGKEIIEFAYTARARGAGTVVLPGICARIYDLHGLFFAQRFLPCRQSYRVMPTAQACARISVLAWEASWWQPC